MAEKRDLLDDIIDIQSDWRAVSNPLGSVVDTLAADPAKAKVWNPGDYKERPRANTVFCLRLSAGTPKACTRCTDVCPTDAIRIENGKIEITDACRKCGLCGVICPTEALTFQRTAPKGLYDAIARVAGAYEQCYVTCTRALGRLPRPNEVVLPCVGAMSEQLWLALLAEYGNVSVYLPLGICDRCRTTTGEELYADAIARAEELAGTPVGLEVDEADLTHELKRAYKRSQFVSSVAQAGATIATRGVPVLAGAKAVAERVQAHSRQLTDLQRSLERAVGAKTAESRRRILTQRRKLVMGALQKHPALADGMALPVPVCDRSLCTMCGDCATACTVHACQIDRGGRFSVEEAYCVNCAACAAICPEGALAMEPGNPASLVLVDPNAEKVAEQRAKVAAAKAKARGQLTRGLDALERLAGDE